MNLHRSETFVLAVVPFDQIAINFGRGSETSKFAGASGALQGTGEDLCERQSGQPFAQPPGIAFATLGQRHIGKPRMLARETPGGFAVPREIKDWKDFAHGVLSLSSQFDFAEFLGVLHEIHCVHSNGALICDWNMNVSVPNINRNLNTLPIMAHFPAIRA